jgi:soluble lytic murein transglycosylase-like protein
LLSHIGAAAKVSSELLIVVLLLAVGVAKAQTAHPDIRNRMGASVQRQRVSADRMKASIEARAQARAEKLSPEKHGDFFLLPPPAGAPASVGKPQCPALPMNQVDELVTEAAETSSVAPDLLRAVMQQESAFRPCAVSSKGAMGLMQLMQPTAIELGVVNAFDPQENVAGGAKRLKQLMDIYSGDVSMALSAYNAGRGRVDQSQGIPQIPETMNYVNRILSAIGTPGLTVDSLAEGQD